MSSENIQVMFGWLMSGYYHKMQMIVAALSESYNCAGKGDPNANAGTIQVRSVRKQVLIL